MAQNNKVHCGCCKWLSAAILLSLLTAGGIYFIVPVQYEAKAWIRIFSEKPTFIYDEKASARYDEFVQTQFALIRNPVILEKALETPGVAKLICVVNQKDKIGWLSKKLGLKQDGKSEMVIVSMKCNVPEEAAKIVNAVVDAYFDFYNLQSQESNNNLIKHLNAELQRQTATARLTQDAIREKLERAAAQHPPTAAQTGTVTDWGIQESLKRDVYLAENQLIGLRAQRQMLQETLEHPEKIPSSVLQQSIKDDPAVQKINEQLDTLRRQREQLRPILATPDDPRLRLLDTQIADLEKKPKVLTDVNDSRSQSVPDSIRTDIERQNWELDMQIRNQEILVKELNDKYAGLLGKSKRELTNSVDMSYDQNQLGRINKVLDALSDRLVKLQAERYAPDQIQLQRRATVPVAPDTAKQVKLIAITAAAVFCFILLLGLAVRHCRCCHRCRKEDEAV